MKTFGVKEIKNPAMQFLQRNCFSDNPSLTGECNLTIPTGNAICIASFPDGAVSSEEIAIRLSAHFKKSSL